MGKFIRFIVLIAIAVWVAHYTVPLLTTLFFLPVLVSYYRSKGNEPFWFAFFFIIQDGVLGYFINFENLVQILPGLPAVEAGQLYIGLTIVKAIRLKEPSPRPFYFNGLFVLLIYLVFLVFQGYAWGVSFELNIQFRIVKFILPLFLLYSIPRLMDAEEQYWQVLSYLFPITFLILFSQVFTIVNGMSPAQFMGIKVESNHLFIVSRDTTYRGFFNDALVLVATFGAYLALGTKENRFPRSYMYMVLISLFLSIFLSATRGWILGFLVVSVGFLLFLSKVRPAQTVKIGVLAVLLVAVLYSLPIIKIQVDNAWDRLMTLQALAEGDLSAGGTLVRLERRSPLVMKRWAESPLTGIGFSNEFFRHSDMHVANQNILLHTGILGALLLFGFLVHFLSVLFFTGVKLPAGHPQKKQLLVFVVFFFGWFLIHSVTSQQFAFYADPHNGMVRAFFFSFAALIYRKAQMSRSTIQAQESKKSIRTDLPKYNFLINARQ